jgi:glycosyltransferase involved in cell wall biosynthesis
MKLSIITICRNEFDSIANTIESVILQSLKNDFEYIVIDGNSNDGTMEIISKYSDNIDKLISENDDGIFDAMNKAIKISNGEYIIFINAGDILVNNEVIKKFIENNDNSDFIFGDVIFQYKNGIKFRRKYPIQQIEKYLLIDSINHQATFIKKSLFDKIGLYDNSLKITADYEWSLKALIKEKCSFQYLKFPITIFNLNGISSSAKFNVLHNLERKLCQSRYFNLEDLRNFNSKKFLYDLYFKKFRYSYFLIRSLLSKRYLYE